MTSSQHCPENQSICTHSQDYQQNWPGATVYNDIRKQVPWPTFILLTQAVTEPSSGPLWLAVTALSHSDWLIQNPWLHFDCLIRNSESLWLAVTEPNPRGHSDWLLQPLQNPWLHFDWLIRNAESLWLAVTEPHPNPWLHCDWQGSTAGAKDEKKLERQVCVWLSFVGVCSWL